MAASSDPASPLPRPRPPLVPVVMSTPQSSAAQKPMRGRIQGKTRNMGSVGITYQNVYQA